MIQNQVLYDLGLEPLNEINRATDAPVSCDTSRRPDEWIAGSGSGTITPPVNTNVAFLTRAGTGLLTRAGTALLVRQGQ